MTSVIAERVPGGVSERSGAARSASFTSTPLPFFSAERRGGVPAELAWRTISSRTAVNSAFNRDYSVIMGITILVGALTILFNLLVDIAYAWIDPKIRY